ncbi:hypothetical protein MIND_01331500 [Mycena indigotica]|uniref:CxC2-like cysteine cluster KDZ transposase-associated domain-containing protein n=1 Tax=Mycena indigotica TaxID=2126181 RepID=A0A8H6S035_9AGAR|nr:uncharacterized protein MIND_01331500 [Mycena indigotica]KAF7290181.1 hypothetical protein MIND_01331500 [Mycena indigotica]
MSQYQQVAVRKRGRPRKINVQEQSIPNNSDDEMYDQAIPAVRTASGELLDLATESISDVDEPAPSIPSKPKRSQGASAKLHDAMERLPSLRKQLTQSLHGNPCIGRLCQCGEPGLFTCTQCVGRQMLCKACVVHQHIRHPFHRIFEWKQDTYGAAFSPVSLIDLGLVWSACMNGFSPCPYAPDDHIPPSKLTVAAVNGLHLVALYERWEQLIQLRLFPATFALPRTAFDFDALEQFHVQSLTSKITAYDYIRSLEKLTDVAFPHDVTDRYREFARSFRIWRFLTLERRSGQEHGIDEHVPHRTGGGLAVRCPACPEIEFNISEQEIEALPDELKYTSRLVLSADANFKAQRKNKKTKEDSADVALNGGHAFFPDDKLFGEYLKAATSAKARDPNPEPEGIICNHFNAKTLQNMAKFKNVVISGVVAIQCARHGFFLPGAMVDLTKGEAYANTDFTLCGVIAENHRNKNIVVTYDIWCQYGINLPKRVEKFFRTLSPVAKLLFRTKEQNHGNRHDSLDEACNNWNWDKFIRLAETLSRLYCDARLQLRKREDDYNGHRSTISAKKLAEWDALAVKNTFDANGKVVDCPFELKLKNGPPTHQAAYKKLIEEEISNEKRRLGSFEGDSAIIAVGLAIEKDQCSVARLVAAKHMDQEELISTRRNQLVAKLNDFRQILCERVPLLKSLLESVIAQKPETARLFLPSEFSCIQQDEYDLSALAFTEYALREGMAHDLLQDIRNAICAFNITIAFKKANIHGTGANTRAQTYAMVQYNDIRILATGYKVQREALMKLGLPANDPVLQPLLKKHLRGERRPSAQSWTITGSRIMDLEGRASTGDTVRCLSIFIVDRMRYFRLRASVDRATEETHILDAEFKRCKRAFTRYTDIWATLAKTHKDGEMGKSAYATKQARMFAKFADRITGAWSSLDEVYASALKRQEKRDAEQAAKDEQEAKHDIEKGDEELFEVELVRDLHTT